MTELGQLVGGKYELVELLGAGGMGSVYGARHQHLGKRVAIKFLHPEIASDREAVARFTREAQAAASIGHRSIIDVYDIGIAADGALFQVMEHLDGQSLRDKLGQGLQLDVSLALYVVCQTLSALDAAHHNGIVHRDLKPDNIFLVKTGQVFPDIKLLDFGISKMVDIRTQSKRLTRSGIVLGTPFYMAPEQARGEKELDQRIDIYAMGVILYEILTGSVPFYAENALALFHKILNDPIEQPRILRPDLPIDLEQIIMRALSREADQRFQSAAEMLGALIPICDSRVVDRVSLPEDLSRSSLQINDVVSFEGSRKLRTVGGQTPASLAEADTEMAWTGRDAIRLGKLRWLIATVAVAVVLLSSGVFFFYLSPTGEHSEIEQSSLSEPPSLVTLNPAEDSRHIDASVRESPPERVTLAFPVLPEGSQITVGDSLVEGQEYQMTASSAPVVVRVVAERFTPWEQTIVPDRDQRIEITLQPASESRPGKARRVREVEREVSSRRSGRGESRRAPAKAVGNHAKVSGDSEPSASPAKAPVERNGDPGFQFDY